MGSESTSSTVVLFAQQALLAYGWAKNVQITINGLGLIEKIQTDLSGPDKHAERIKGVLIPGMGNCHSHSFQRGMAGLAEVGGNKAGDFWGWRELMYRFAATIGPAELRAIAAQLYVEMLKSGYTGVAEFHYLHHAPSGAVYDDPAEMSYCIVQAAQQAGIQLTLLPALYKYADFNCIKADMCQRRFVCEIDDFIKILEHLASKYSECSDFNLGMALHSLRAVDEPLLTQALSMINSLHPRSPIHIHIAEQTREVEACLAHTGQRPVDWLLNHTNVDERWCLIHASHLSNAEIVRLAKSNAVVGLCPTTEANLGDGIFPALEYFRHNSRFAIGSDSHISISPVEELRLLEYGQRLIQRRRTLLAGPDSPSVGANLYRQALLGGAQALGSKTGTISTGMRADFLVLNVQDPVLYGKRGDQLLDAWVFASQRPVVKDVMVAGEWQIHDGRHCREESILQEFFNAIDRLHHLI